LRSALLLACMVATGELANRPYADWSRT